MNARNNMHLADIKKYNLFSFPIIMHLFFLVLIISKFQTHRSINSFYDLVPDLYKGCSDHIAKPDSDCKVKNWTKHPTLQHLTQDVNLTWSSAVVGTLICQRDLASSPLIFCRGAMAPMVPFSNYGNIKRNIWR